MARKAGKRRKTAANGPAKAASSAPKTRRQVVTGIATYLLGGTVVIGGGAAFARDFSCKMQEADLSRIGNGRATVVQIHDPQCSQCRALQVETRDALKAFDDDIQYLVANIRSAEGAAFANSRGLGHVTLVLLDGQGRQRHVVTGVVPAERLRATFQQHFQIPPES